MSETTKAPVKPERKVTDARVIAEFNLSRIDYLKWTPDGLREKTHEEFAKMLEERCKEFEEFMRDHRSQDSVSLTVERVVSEVCSGCGQEWEEAKDEQGRYCAWCGANLAES